MVLPWRRKWLFHNELQDQQRRIGFRAVVEKFNARDGRRPREQSIVLRHKDFWSVEKFNTIVVEFYDSPRPWPPIFSTAGVRDRKSVV
jgi:hypothetical protein